MWTDVEECGKQVWTERRVNLARMFPRQREQPNPCNDIGNIEDSRVDYVYCFGCVPERGVDAQQDKITDVLERMRVRLQPEVATLRGDVGYADVRNRVADELEFVGVYVGVDKGDRTRVVAFEPRVTEGSVATEDTDTVLTVLKLWWEGYQQRSGADGARLGADGQFVSVDGACPAVRFKLNN